MGRQTIGRGAKAIQESATMKKLVKSGGVGGILGRNLEKGLKRTSESSMDLRNTGIGKATSGAVGGLGDVGGKGGFAKSFKDSQKSWEDQQKRVKEMSPAEQSEKEALEARNAADAPAMKAAENTQKLAEEEVKRAEEEEVEANKGFGAGTARAAEATRKVAAAKEELERAKELVGTFEDNVKKADDIKKNADKRGETFATADTVSKLASIIGITTAQMAMVRKVREEKNKSPEDRALDALVRKATEKIKDGDKEKKEPAEEKPPKA